jgi:hypothetical protein
MTTRERFLNVMNFSKDMDRLPVMEWAPWWDKTQERWKMEGLPPNLSPEAMCDFMGLDEVARVRLRPVKNTFPKLEYGQGIVSDEASYDKVRPHLYPDDLIASHRDYLLNIKSRQASGSVIFYIQLDGFFWHPRKLFGIENHFYAFHDYPKVMHKMNEDLTEYNCRLIKGVCEVCTPDFIVISEDMSYNQGPMISKQLFDEFINPYYKKIIPLIRSYNALSFIDTDGNIVEMLPWITSLGVDGILPLERQAGVNVVKIREDYPSLRMIGAYDKRAMCGDEEIMRLEFERLLPVMRQGGFIAACDHQTPPQVSLENYRTYVRLLREYGIRAAAIC